MDDHIPIRLEKGKKILIPEGKYHRLIKGTGDLTLEVKFIKTKKKNPWLSKDNVLSCCKQHKLSLKKTLSLNFISINIT